jgi:hypothetical protein
VATGSFYDEMMSYTAILGSTDLPPVTDLGCGHGAEC